MRDVVCVGCGCTDAWGCPAGCAWVVVSARRGLVCSQCTTVAAFTAFRARLRNAIEVTWHVLRQHWRVTG